ncbi:hypothetical protein ELI15_17295 [Rhizobium ruizarguesonis]|uniref:hypothetical protein n=1 Tax=Rhizobium ruizarguesonis TaxID=2081791 RepID=UPI00103123F7|nr:hypothetical protein [Rhizobium ruizarguesonis]TAW66015.1 hypothetical protein ELI15_17295 [Rhizobium ruizarguesonis]
MKKSNSMWVLMPVRIQKDVFRGVENLSRLTTKSKGHIIRRAVETYMLYEGADIVEEIRDRKQAAGGQAVDVSDITRHLEEIIVRFDD